MINLTNQSHIISLSLSNYENLKPSTPLTYRRLKTKTNWREALIIIFDIFRLQKNNVYSKSVTLSWPWEKVDQADGNQMKR